MSEYDKEGNLVYSAEEIEKCIYERNYDAGYCYIVEHHVYADIEAMLADVRMLADLNEKDEIISATDGDERLIVRYTPSWCIEGECEHVPEESLADGYGTATCPTPEIREEWVSYESKTLWKFN